LKKVLDTVNSKGFKNSYKGVFSEKKLPEENLDKLREFLERTLEKNL